MTTHSSGRMARRPNYRRGPAQSRRIDEFGASGSKLYSPPTRIAHPPRHVTAEPSTPIPLCVDMDGTLFRSDALWEGVVGMLRQASPSVLATPLWLGRGKAYLKQRVAQADACDATQLP